MAIQQSKPAQDIKLDTDGIANLRYYKSKKGTVMFVNGFCYNMETKETNVIYTNGLKGTPMILPTKKFKENFMIE